MSASGVDSAWNILTALIQAIRYRREEDVVFWGQPVRPKKNQSHVFESETGKDSEDSLLYSFITAVVGDSRCAKFFLSKLEVRTYRPT